MLLNKIYADTHYQYTSISLLLGSSLNSNVVVTAAVAVGSEKEGRSTVMLLTTAGSRMKSWPDTMRDIITKENKMTAAECK